MAITFNKLVSGCLYAKNNNGDFPDPFITTDTGHWDVPSSKYVLSVSAGRLRIYYSVGVNGSRTIRNNQVSSQSKTYVFASLESENNPSWTNFMGVAAHIQDITYHNENGILYYLRTNNTSTNTRIAEAINGSFTSLDYLPIVWKPHGTYVYWLFADGNNIAAFDDFHLTDLTGVSTVHDQGQPGLVPYGGYAVTFVNDYIVMTDRYLTVTGLLLGDVVELRKSNDDVITFANESSGIAVLDVYKEVITDIYKIVIVRNSQDAGEYVISTGDYICGGDVYETITPPSTIENKVNSLLIEQFRRQYGTG
jgi:hypothetical protein